MKLVKIDLFFLKKTGQTSLTGLNTVKGRRQSNAVAMVMSVEWRKN